ncbi:MAG: YbjN domain-containing protein [Actinomycetota bacterium]|nr:YbjN domain-containing protein [Actinomycetota bacterium]
MIAPDVIESYLTAQQIPYQRSTDVWALQLHGEKKHSIPVTLGLRERTMSVESFFMRRPQEAAGEFYRLLLARNMRPSRVRFATDADGDVYLVGEVTIDAIDEETLDALLGEILYTADQMFDPAMAVGFASYLERDRAWREKQVGAKDA